MTTPRKLPRNAMSKSGITLHGGGYPYHIDVDRIDTPGKLLRWIAHLSIKQWFTMYDLHDLLAYASQQGVDPHAAPF